MSWTNRGKRNILAATFRGEALPSNLYVALVTSAVAPTVDTNTLGELTEITAGNGYTSGGLQVDLNETDFDFLEEDDTLNRARVQLKDQSWTATGGTMPSSGAARYAVLTDDDGTIANREVWAYWDLSSDRSVEDGRKLILVDLELIVSEP